MRNLFLLAIPLALVAQSQPTISVGGRVIGPDGKPILGGVVALISETGNDTLRDAMVGKTDGKGRFHFSCTPGLKGFTVTAPGMTPYFCNFTLAAGTILAPVEVRMALGGFRVQGKVVAPQGHRLEDLRVSLSKFSDDKGDSFFATLKGGSFEVQLAPGKYLINAAAKGLKPARYSQTIEVKAPTSDVIIQLRGIPTPAIPAVTSWIASHAIPLTTVEAGHGFKDMQPLKALVGNATMVALGEATHGTREFFQLKHRILEFLVAEMGFTAFGIEANLPEAFAIDRYVLTGEGDPVKALAGLHFWTWNTEEVLDMIKWMRSYNADPVHTKKVRFYGFDMQTETVALSQAKDWLGKVAPEEVKALEGAVATFPTMAVRQQGQISVAVRKAIEGAIQSLQSLIARLESRRYLGDQDVFDRQRQNLRVLTQYAEMQADPMGGYKVRDASMAANAQWIQEREKGGKVMLWAHNGHIGRGTNSMPGSLSMGCHLRKALGASYRPIGFVFREGGFQAQSGEEGEAGLKAFEVKGPVGATMDAALSKVGKSVFALDLQVLPKSGAVRNWFSAYQGTWSIGAFFAHRYAPNYVLEDSFTESYDALLFVNSTTAARPVGGRTTMRVVPKVSTATSGTFTNLDFEDGESGSLKGWFLPPSPNFVGSITTDQPKEGGHCLEVAFASKTPDDEAWYSVMQAVDATPYRGKKVRLTGWVRTDGKAVLKAGLWMRVDRQSGTGFFDNMMNRAITSTTWTEASIEGEVAEDARNLNIGALVMGCGKA